MKLPILLGILHVQPTIYNHKHIIPSITYYNPLNISFERKQQHATKSMKRRQKQHHTAYTAWRVELAARQLKHQHPELG